LRHFELYFVELVARGEMLFRISLYIQSKLSLQYISESATTPSLEHTTKLQKSSNNCTSRLAVIHKSHLMNEKLEDIINTFSRSVE